MFFMFRFQTAIAGYWNMTATDIQNGQVNAKSVGASLLAMRAYQTTDYSLTHCYREQARSYRGYLLVREVMSSIAS